MKVVVTGGAGFIGSHLVDALVEQGNEVGVIDNLSTGKRENVNSSARLYEQDIRDPDLSGVLTDIKPDVVFHLAAQVKVPISIREPILDADVNIMGSLNLLEVCVACGVKRLVFASSAAVYGNPTRLPVNEEDPISPLAGLGVSKSAVERYLEVFRLQHRLDYVVCRYSNVYGERQDAAGEGGVVAIFAQALQEGTPPRIFGDGEQTRDFIYVKDVAAANLKAATVSGSHIINVSNGHSISINELYKTMAAIHGFPLGPVYVAERPGDIRESRLDNGKARQVLNWQPVYRLSDGLARMFQNTRRDRM